MSSYKKHKRAQKNWPTLFFNQRRTNRLRVKTQAPRGNKKVPRWLNVLAMLGIGVALAALVWWAACQLGYLLFHQNSFFQVRNIKIECFGDIVTPKYVAESLGVQENDNIFALDIGETQRRLAKEVPNIKAVKIGRHLPGDLVVQVQERLPVARLQMDNYFLGIDQDGCVFRLSPRARTLPIIAGHDRLRLSVRPGSPLTHANAAAALELIQMCETPELRRFLNVSSIDIQSDKQLEVCLSNGSRVRLAWPEMGQGSALSRNQLEQKLLKLAEIIKTAAIQNRHLALLDMTLDNNFYVPSEQN